MIDLALKYEEVISYIYILLICILLFKLNMCFYLCSNKTVDQYITQKHREIPWTSMWQICLCCFLVPSSLSMSLQNSNSSSSCEKTLFLFFPSHSLDVWSSVFWCFATSLEFCCFLFCLPNSGSLEIDCKNSILGYVLLGRSKPLSLFVRFEYLQSWHDGSCQWVAGSTAGQAFGSCLLSSQLTKKLRQTSWLHHLSLYQPACG